MTPQSRRDPKSARQLHMGVEFARRVFSSQQVEPPSFVKTAQERTGWDGMGRDGMRHTRAGRTDIIQAWTASGLDVR